MKKITIIGGDERLKAVKEKLEGNGYIVDTLGLFSGDKGDPETSAIIILPVPTTKDSVNVYAPLTGRLIPLKWVEEQITPEKTVLCCNYHVANCRCIDYNRLDSYALLNAVPTAEGAIKLCIENTPFTLWRASVLVIGYGRVGKILADRLRGMGANVTVSARKNADFALLRALNYNTADTTALNDKPLLYDVVFNTVDFPVLSDQTLKTTSCRCLIDLSSKGGFDLETAKSLGITAIKAPGLPGIIAPKTAGEILAETLTTLIVSN